MTEIYRNDKYNITLYNDDCFNVFPLLKDQSIDLILTDPPYNIIDCEWDNLLDFDQMWCELKRLTKDDHTPILLFGGEPFTSKLILSHIKGFKYRLDWDKVLASGMLYCKYRPMQQIEDIVVFTRTGQKTYYYPNMIPRDKPLIQKASKNFVYSKSIGKREFTTLAKTYTHKPPTNLITFPKIVSNSIHPTQKPVELIEYLLTQYSLEHETILDFTSGSGSTAIACIGTKRKFIGCELNHDYFHASVERIEKYIENLEKVDLFGFSNPKKN